MRIPIVFSTDHNFIVPTGVSIASLLRNSGDADYEIYILSAPSVTDNDKHLLEQQVKSLSDTSTVKFISVDNAFKDAFETRGISNATYYRLLIPWLIPEHDKILYSDGDVVFNMSLQGAYDFELGDALAAGVGGKVWSSKVQAKRITALGVDPSKYVNAGFLLLNAAAMRKEGLKDTFLKLAEKKFPYQDQDILNIACNGRILKLPETFNYSKSLAQTTFGKDYSLSQIAVIHYTHDKPWNGPAMLGDIWWENYRHSVFYDDKTYRRYIDKTLSYKKMTKAYLKRVKASVRSRVSILFKHP